MQQHVASGVFRMRERNVFISSRFIYLFGLSGEYRLDSAEYKFDQLHLQRRIFGGKWRPMHGLRHG